MKILNFNISSAVLLLLGIILFALIIRPRVSSKEGFGLFANPVKEVKSVLEGLGMIGGANEEETDDESDGSDDEEEDISDEDTSN